MVTFTPQGALAVFGEKITFEIQEITKEEAREILAELQRRTVGSLTVDDMIAWPTKAWYVGDVLGIADVHLYWGVWNTPALTRVVVLSEATAEIVT